MRNAHNRYSKTEKIREIILELDKFRYGITVDLDRLEKYVFDSDLGEYWPTWKSHVNGILKRRLSDPLIRKYALIRLSLRVLAMLSIVIANFVLFIALVNPGIIFVQFILNPLIAISLIFIVPYLCLIIYYFIGKLIVRKARVYSAGDNTLRKIINELIRALLIEAKRSKLNKEDLTMEFFFNDYQYIEIVRERNKKYIVVPSIK